MNDTKLFITETWSFNICFLRWLVTNILKFFLILVSSSHKITKLKIFENRRKIRIQTQPPHPGRKKAVTTDSKQRGEKIYYTPWLNPILSKEVVKFVWIIWFEPINVNRKFFFEVLSGKAQLIHLTRSTKNSRFSCSDNNTFSIQRKEKWI